MFSSFSDDYVDGDGRTISSIEGLDAITLVKKMDGVIYVGLQGDVAVVLDAEGTLHIWGKGNYSEQFTSARWGTAEKAKVKKMVVWTTGSTSAEYMCNNLSSLTDIDFTGWDTSSITDMRCMFSGCSSLANLDLSKWDTSSVTDMRSMFNGCSSLTSLDLSKWNTSSVTDMCEMFNWCSSLTSLDLSSGIHHP